MLSKAQLLQSSEDSVMAATDLAELERPTLELALTARGHQAFRARQLFGWIYRRGVSDLSAMTDLPRDPKGRIAAEF